MAGYALECAYTALEALYGREKGVDFLIEFANRITKQYGKRYTFCGWYAFISHGLISYAAPGDKYVYFMIDGMNVIMYQV